MSKREKILALSIGVVVAALCGCSGPESIASQAAAGNRQERPPRPAKSWTKSPPNAAPISPPKSWSNNSANGLLTMIWTRQL